MASSKAAAFENKAANSNVQIEKNKPAKIQKPGWNANGNSGGGHTAHDGKYKKNNTRKVVYDPNSLPEKKSLTDLP